MNATKETLELLGITREELIARVIDRMTERCFKIHRVRWDEDGDEYSSTDETEFAKALSKHVKKRIDERVDRLSEDVVAPKIAEMVEGLVLQETNKWGEKKGTALTFVEYLVQRADHYLTEPVDYQGNPRGDNYNWKATGTRVAVLIEKHLHYSIETAMKKALEGANATIVEGLEKAIKIQLATLAERMTAKVVVKA